MTATVLLLTCEHAGNRVPARWRPLARGREALLDSHRGWDPGALALARALARALGAPLLACHHTRLLVDPNRSDTNPAVFSELTRGLSRSERADLLRTLWRPHRDAVEEAIAGGRAGGRTVLHVGVHSFTPVLHGRRRTADVGLLYDPSRPAERALAARWQEGLAARAPDLRVRRNYPYRGSSDGLTTALRRRFPERYLGLELEVGQEALAGAGRRALHDALARTLEEAAGTLRGW